jgi:hypothetical protein
MAASIRLVVLLAGLLVAAATPAQQPQPVRVRGTVQSFDGQKLAIATKSDGVVQLAVSDTTGINGLAAKTVADIGDKTFIGATAVKDAKGRWQATEIHIFPESMRGAGEGHYAWDLPESSMTNGAVTGSVAGGSGLTLHVAYSGGAPGAAEIGATDIDVTPKTAIVALTPGDRASLVPGATVFALAIPQPGGPAAAIAIVAETKGVKPPM